ncbi:hypothetical protein [Escherichia coli]|nr:hypothetical protein [Escherichia coli]
MRRMLFGTRSEKLRP